MKWLLFYARHDPDLVRAEATRKRVEEAEEFWARLVEWKLGLGGANRPRMN